MHLELKMRNDMASMGLDFFLKLFVLFNLHENVSVIISARLFSSDRFSGQGIG